MDEHMAIIERFRCGIRLEERPNEEEIRLINDVCNCNDVAAGLDHLREKGSVLSSTGLKLLTSAAACLWQDLKQPYNALAVCTWSIEVAHILSDARAEAATLWMQVGLFLANDMRSGALGAISRGKEVCDRVPGLSGLRHQFEDAESQIRSAAQQDDLPSKSPCDICGRVFRIDDGGQHVVLSRKHNTFTKSAHCFNCGLVICFGCALWKVVSLEEAKEKAPKDMAALLKTPCCPVCKAAIGSRDETAEYPEFRRLSNENVFSYPIPGRVRSLLSTDDLRVLLSATEAATTRDAILGVRTQVENPAVTADQSFNRIAAAATQFDVDLGQAISHLGNMVSWIREKQLPPDIQTVDAYELRPSSGQASEERVENLLRRADALLARGELSRALHEIRQAREMAANTRDRRRLARSYLTQGLVYREASRIDEAKKSFDRALEVAEELGDELLQAKAHGNLAGSFLGTMPDREVIDHAKAALRIYKAAGDQTGLGRTLHNLGTFHLSKGDPSLALKYFEEALTLKRKAGDQPAIASTLGNMATAQRKLGEPKTALALATEALALCRSFASPMELAVNLSDTATAALDVGARELAIRLLAEAVEVLEKVRASTSDASLRETLLDRYRATYHTLAKLYLESDRPGECVRTLECLSAAAIAEHMANPGLMKLSVASPGGQFIAELPLPEISDSLVWDVTSRGVPTAIVQYVFVEKDLYAFVALPDRQSGDWLVHRYEGFGYDAAMGWFMSPPVPPNQFSGGWFGPLHDLRGAIRGRVFQYEMRKEEFDLWMRGRMIDKWRSLLEDLGARLFLPLVEAIRKSGATRIQFVPMGMFSHLPLHAMKWKEGKKEKVVADEFDVLYSPSLRILALSREISKLTGNRLLVISDPAGDLPLASVEAHILRDVGLDCTVLSGPEASLTRVMAEANSADIVHAATHAITDSMSARLSGLCLAISKSEDHTPDKCFVNHQGDVVSTKHHARYRLASVPELFGKCAVRRGATVVLAGCDTGSAVLDPGGEKVASLSAAFLASGARTVICTQWPVDSLVSLVFSILFYSAFPENDAVTALASAERTMRSLTADEVCHLLNERVSRIPQAPAIGVEDLSRMVGSRLTGRDRPFCEAFFWGAFSLWGAA